MRFVCLVVVDEKKLAAMTRQELQHLDDISLDFDDELRRNGQFLAAAALQPICKTVRANNGKTLVTDGPFIETKEQVGGFILIEAKNLEAAVQAASKIPAVQLGYIEVRPVKELRRSA